MDNDKPKLTRFAAELMGWEYCGDTTGEILEGPNPGYWKSNGEFWTDAVGEEEKVFSPLTDANDDALVLKAILAKWPIDTLVEMRDALILAWSKRDMSRHGEWMPYAVLRGLQYQTGDYTRAAYLAKQAVKTTTTKKP